MNAANKMSFAKNRNEHREQKILLQRMEINAENETFFWKEHKRTWKQNVLLKKELKNVLFFFLFLSVLFLVFCHFWTTFDTKKTFFWLFLGPNLTQKNKTFFLKNGKENREWNVLSKRTEKNVRMKHSFEKNVCPTLTESRK